MTSSIERGRPLVVGAAVVRAGRLLACRRIGPASLAGQWEFPGGKVEEGETPHAALVRECAEELDIRVTVGAQLGSDVEVGPGAFVLQVFWCTIAAGVEPTLRDHDCVRWLHPGELFTVPWIEVDLGLVSLAAEELSG